MLELSLVKSFCPQNHLKPSHMSESNFLSDLVDGLVVSVIKNIVAITNKEADVHSKH